MLVCNDCPCFPLLVSSSILMKSRHSDDPKPRKLRKSSTNKALQADGIAQGIDALSAMVRWRVHAPLREHCPRSWRATAHKNCERGHPEARHRSQCSRRLQWSLVSDDGHQAWAPAGIGRWPRGIVQRRNKCAFHRIHAGIDSSGFRAERRHGDGYRPYEHRRRPASALQWRPSTGESHFGFGHIAAAIHAGREQRLSLAKVPLVRGRRRCS